MLIVSVRGQQPSEWITRPNHIYVGRRVPIRNGAAAGQLWPTSPLANPWKVTSTEDVAEVLDKYETWLRASIVSYTDSAVFDALRALNADSVLGCWCAPGPCHAHIIEKIWKEL